MVLYFVVDENARWRWQHIPFSVQSGVKLDAWLHQQKGTEESPENISRAQTLRLFPYARIKIKNPVFGKLGIVDLQLTVHNVWVGFGYCV